MVDIRRFVDIQLNGQKQIIGRPIAIADNIVCVMLALSREYGKDRFYVLSLKALQELLITGHRSYLEKHGGVRHRPHLAEFGRLETAVLCGERVP